MKIIKQPVNTEGTFFYVSALLYILYMVTNWNFIKIITKLFTLFCLICIFLSLFLQLLLFAKLKKACNNELLNPNSKIYKKE